MKRTLILVAAALLGLIRSVAAHDLGVTQAIATFHADGTYQVDVSVDPDALLTKLEVAGAQAISSTLPPADRDRRIASLGEVFLDGVDIGFDGHADRPRFLYQPGPVSSDSTQTPSRIRLTGAVPNNARAWTFQYAYAMGWFALDTQTGGAAQTVWLEGGKPGAPMTVGVARTRTERSGPERVFKRVAPLFVLGIVFISRRRR